MDRRSCYRRRRGNPLDAHADKLGARACSQKEHTTQLKKQQGRSEREDGGYGDE